MPERRVHHVYSIAAHRGFADALVAGLIPRYSEPDFGLARLTLLLPSRRAERIVTEAFVRALNGGLLLPRMAVVGDLDLDETLGPLLDPLSAGADIPPAADPVRRWFRLAEHIRTLRGANAPDGAALLRQALAVGQTMDRLLVEGVGPDDIMAPEILAVVKEQSAHWEEATRTFLQVQAHWLAELGARGEVDAPSRRNQLFQYAAARWQAAPPPHPVVAAGVTSASPALADLLKVIAALPNGAVILPDLVLTMDAEVWDELGVAAAPDAPAGETFGKGDAVTHPQYHLKVLLNRMSVARSEVTPWHRSGLAAAPAARSRAISAVFLPPRASAVWAELTADQRRLAGVRVMQSAHPGEEAQAIALLMREALQTPEKRVALVTPDRDLAGRVVAHLKRWNIEADDTAGQPLALTAAGRVFLLAAEVMASEAAPVPLVALLGHPLVRAGEPRADWLDNVRDFDLAMRGPRPDAGFDAVTARLNLPEHQHVAPWWAEARAMIEGLAAPDELPLAEALDRLAQTCEALGGVDVWGRSDGRALAAMIDELREAARETGIVVPTRDLPPLLRDGMDRIAVRPVWGRHPRVAIYGLLEARMARADLVICGGMREGTWPAAPAPDPLLPPAVLRALGVPGAEFRIGLSAHDLAAALGAPEVVLSWAERDSSGPAVPSRFVMRVVALLGQQADEHAEREAVRLARAIDDAEPAPAYPIPAPRPSADQRKVGVSATALDRLRGQPYQFYAISILRLRSPEALDAAPTPAWQGQAAHDILDTWWRETGAAPGQLHHIAERELQKMSAHPLTRLLWQPRLVAALDWIDAETRRLRGEGRIIAATECDGSFKYKGVRVHARADRIDRKADGTLAVVDYKTGQPPSGKQVEKGYALQLGIIGLIAREGGFEELAGEPEAFEYWSLARNKESGFGFTATPVKTEGKRSGIPLDEFLDHCEGFLADALDRWIVGDEPFTAEAAPDFTGYNDYDQLMRLDEWAARGRDDGAEAQ